MFVRFFIVVIFLFLLLFIYSSDEGINQLFIFYLSLKAA